MTARLRIVIDDDLDAFEHDGHTEADETVTLSLDGEVRELDLTAAHAAGLRQLLRRYLDAGHAPGTPPLPAEPPQRQAVSGQVSGWKLGRDMREWADQNMPGSYTRRANGRTGYDYDPALPVAYHGYLRGIGSPWQHHKMFTYLDRS